MKIKSKLGKSILYYWLPVFVWAITIFLFSAHPTSKASQIYWQDFVVKKLAHIIEYAFFSALIFRALKHGGLRKRESIIAAIIFAILYGISDEIHQSFTPGREPRLRDVFFDGFGSIISMYIIGRVLPVSKGNIRKVAEKLHLL